MNKVRKQLSRWGRFKALFALGPVHAIVTIWQLLWWKVRGEALHAQLQDQTSPLRDEAQLAVDRVIYETHIAPDCAVAMIVRGGTAISIKHEPHGNGATQTVFIGNTYEEAANKAIEWINLQGEELSTKKVTRVFREDRKKFDAIRRKKQKARRRRH